MTQVGEGTQVTIISIEVGQGKECVFCGKSHQDEDPLEKFTFKRNMQKLKNEGRSVTIAGSRAMRYPGEDKPPLTDWKSDPLLKSGGYKAAAHHCIALSTLSDHEISGELHAAGYDPNNGNNCIWLPYNQEQFMRARAYGPFRGMQKHRGKHAGTYFEMVKSHLGRVTQLVELGFCKHQRKVSKGRLLRYMRYTENNLWGHVANATDTAYFLYTESSFLDPRPPWGAYPEEEGITETEYLGADTSANHLADDAAVEDATENGDDDDLEHD